MNDARKTGAYLLGLVAAMIAVLFASCTESDKAEEFRVNGVWELQQVEDMYGDTHPYPDNGITWLRIYDDSCYYECQQSTAPNGTMISPSEIEDYTFVDKGHGDILYLQGVDTHPLTIVNDTVMTIQETGRKYTWKRCRDFNPKRRDEIVGAIRRDAENAHEGSLRYVFSTTEEELKTANHTLIYILIGVAAVFVLLTNYAHSLYKNKKRVEQELRLIEQERKTMPEPVRQAMDSVADEFHHSEFYLSLRKRIAQGERLRKEDWDEIEVHFQRVYPRFSSTLLSLHSNMSKVEHQVCILLKLNASPSEIASVLCKDTSSISSIRSRLYKKVFDKKGSSKDWDAFIVSL